MAGSPVEIPVDSVFLGTTSYSSSWNKGPSPVSSTTVALSAIAGGTEEEQQQDNPEENRTGGITVGAARCGLPGGGVGF